MEEKMGKDIHTPEDFSAFVKEVEGQEGYRKPAAFGIGIAHLNEEMKRLDAFFPFPNYQQNYGSAAVVAHAVGHLNGTQEYLVRADQMEMMLSHFAPFRNDGKGHGNIDAVRGMYSVAKGMRGAPIRRRAVVLVFIDQPEHDRGPKSVSDAYLRLHLLSHRLVKPNQINLDGIFDILPNVAWTDEGPIDLKELPGRRLDALKRGYPLHVHAVDKFPPMLDYVVPGGVRVADAARVRLGAHLGDGTTVMHEGFFNFNAGTLGQAMIEGRISAGVVVGDQSDIGGGASIMGSLSGGGKVQKITIGRGCLIGANAGTGISLGDLCVIEAGLYITAGMPVTYNGNVIKAAELSGKNGLTFRRNGSEGHVEVLDKPNKVTLNEVLHKN